MLGTSIMSASDDEVSLEEAEDRVILFFLGDVILSIMM